MYIAVKTSLAKYFHNNEFILQRIYFQIPKQKVKRIKLNLARQIRLRERERNKRGKKTTKHFWNITETVLLKVIVCQGMLIFLKNK